MTTIHLNAGSTTASGGEPAQEQEEQAELDIVNGRVVIDWKKPFPPGEQGATKAMQATLNEVNIYGRDRLLLVFQTQFHLKDGVLFHDCGTVAEYWLSQNREPWGKTRTPMYTCSRCWVVAYWDDWDGPPPLPAPQTTSVIKETGHSTPDYDRC